MTYFVVLSVSFGLNRGRVIGCFGSRAVAERERAHAESEYAKDPNGRYAVVRIFNADKIPSGMYVTV